MSTRVFDQQEPELPDRVGEVVASRYRLAALLGRGGMGCVYRAQHVELDEPVVIKFIDPAFAQNPIARARFRREAKALMRLRHPGVVTMHEFGEDAGGLFLVMELLEGRTLGDELKNPLPLGAIYEIFLQLAGVLEAAHAAGVIHRDIKPDNVMLVAAPNPSQGQADRAILMDFGLANFEESKDVKVSATGSVVGTPAYMSPEQCMGRDIGPASDIYSLGMMFFEALVGRHPFDEGAAAVMMSQHMFVAPPRLERLASGEAAPPGLVKLVEDMVCKQPESRPSATEFLRRLDEVRSGQDPQAFGSRASERRLADAGKTRDERGLPSMPAVHAGDAATDPTMAAPLARPAQPLVWLRGFPAERANHLVASLAVNGLAGICGDSLALLGPPEVRGGLQAAVLSGQADSRAPEVLRELRQQPEVAALPVLVIDVPGATELAELIRAGASDAALAVLGDDGVVAKIWRLIRRKR